jgi:hypothetical protein
MRLVIAALMFCIWIPGGGFARDLGQWKDVDPAIATWYRTLRQPDNNLSCCGEADAYEADEVHSECDDAPENTPIHNCRIIAVVTDERPDEPLMRAHVPVGTRFVVPPNKITWVDGNPTGHVIIFLGSQVWIGGSHDPASRSVLCYVMNGGT